MNQTMKKTCYTEFHKLLHWVSAVVILWTLVSGFYVSLADVSSVLKERVSFINVSLTTLYLPFFIVRLYVTFIYYRSPHALHRSLADYLALGIHMLIHMAVTVVLVTGILMMDRAINVFGLFTLPQPLDDPHLIELFFRIHIWACMVLAQLVFLHIAAVIKHELVGHPVLDRMLFRRQSWQRPRKASRW